MKLQNLASLAALVPYVLAFPHLENFPPYRSLRGLSPEEMEFVARQFPRSGDSPPGLLPFPPPQSFTGTKLVNDADHPFEYDIPGVTIRGPCPGLNTLSAHGFLNRTGITTPNDIINAVQEGFNMGFDFARFLCLSGFLVDGNILTNQLTIGRNITDGDTLISGISTHGTFEGDGSITRHDIFLGDNINPNVTLFQVLNDTAVDGFIDRFGGATDRRNRVLDSIARNPIFSYHSPRFVGATAETGFMLAMFTQNQTSNQSLPLRAADAFSIFVEHKFPDNFHRRSDPYDFAKVRAFTAELIDLVGIAPGSNNGVNNYVPAAGDPHDFCAFYQGQATIVGQIYAGSTGNLRAAAQRNLEIYYETLGDSTCPQIFPLGH